MANTSQVRTNASFLPMFEYFREELDIHHDRRERIIKASRDITAASKKIIFALQRTRELGQPIPDPIGKSCLPCFKNIETQYKYISGDTQGINAFRYANNLYGHQEFVEALSFQYYLETQSLITYQQVCERLAACGSIYLPPEDYILGIYDTTGELMRFAIAAMATTGRMPKPVSESTGTHVHIPPGDMARPQPVVGVEKGLLADMRELRRLLDNFDTAAGSPAFRAEAERKNDVMRTSVDKVENALYGLIVRSNEANNVKNTLQIK